MMKRRQLISNYRPITFVKHAPGMTYTSRRKMPLKIGDMILIDDCDRKNNVRPFFEVISSPGYLEGIDWHNHQVATKRVGTNSNKIHVWDMSFIREVCEKENYDNEQILHRLTEQEKVETFFMKRENSSSFQRSFYTENENFDQN